MVKKTLLGGLFSLLVLGGIYVLGFVVFYVSLPASLAPNTLPKMDAVAVFTGDTGRVAAGLHLLEKTRKPTLITGVHPQVSLYDLLQGKAIPADTLAFLTLDHTAQTTRQNVDVLAKWAQLHGYKRVGVISSHYHYPRIFVLAALFAPAVEVVTLPVRVHTPFMFYVREYGKLWLAPWLK